MTTHQLRPQLAALRLALDFAQGRCDHRQFLRLARSASESDGGNWIKAGEGEVPGLRDMAKAVLAAIVERRELELLVTLRLDVKRRGDSVIVCRRSLNTTDLFLYRLVRLLEDVGVERLRVCAAPDCDQPFLKTGRKEYCSTECQVRVNNENQRRHERKWRLEQKKGGKHGKKTRTR